jgi:hypothetical protein
MADLSLGLTYAPVVGTITTNDVSGLLQGLETAYQAAGSASRLGERGSAELWSLATRRAAADAPLASTRRLISEIEYLDRAARREDTRATRAAYDIASDGLLRELDRFRRTGALPRLLPPLECIRLRMESPLAVLLGIPDAFVYVGGVSGIGALVALIEKQANVFGRIKLERDTLKLKQTRAIFGREQLEEEQRKWREALDEVVLEPEDDVTTDGPMRTVSFKLDTGELGQVPPTVRPDQLDE